MIAPWVVFAAAALCCSAGQLYGFAMRPAVVQGTVLTHTAAMGLFALGVGWRLHQRDRERLLEIILDAALIVTAATVVTMRWAPAAQAILNEWAEVTAAQTLGVFGVPIAAGVAFLFASVLVLVRASGRMAPVAFAIFVATAAFGLAAAPFAIGIGTCCRTGDAASVPFIIGWISLSYAALLVRHAEPELVDEFATGDAGGSRVRMVVAPAVAVVMGAVVVDTVWRGPLQEATAAAFGMLGVILAGRVSQLLFATRTQSAERVELAHSRAMIEVSQALSGTTRLDETLELVTQWAVRLMDARTATIELLAPDGRTLVVHAGHGQHAPPIHHQFPVDGSFTGWVVQHGRARFAADAHTDPYLHPSSRQYVGSAPLAAAPLRYRGATLGALACVGRYAFTGADVELLGALADQAAVAIENARLFEQVHQLSVTDPLTGLSNRRQLERDLAREFAAARRGRPLVAVMFDLNGFKEYNDRYGHVAGDEALKLFAKALHTETRAMNTVARYGGDEFIALLADNDARGTEVFIERVRRRFPGADAAEKYRQLSVSAGFAQYDSSMMSPEDLVAAADQALYREKSQLRPQPA